MSPRRLPAAGAALLAVVVCGAALAFPPCEDLDGDGFLRPAGCGTVADCNDDDAAVHPGAVEVCDGVDNDCDGEVDEAPSCDRTCDNPELIGPPVMVSAALGDHGGARPDLAWSGDDWIVTYISRDTLNCYDIFGEHLLADGEPSGAPTQLFGMPHDRALILGTPRLAWTGSELGVVWWPQLQAASCDTTAGVVTSARFQRFSSDFSPLGPRLQFPESGCPGSLSDVFTPRTAWNGQVFALTWQSSTPDALATTIDRHDKATDACGIVVNHESPSSPATPASNGDVFGLAYQTDQYYFRRMADDASFIDPAPTRITSALSFKESEDLLWGPNEWAFSWGDDRDSSVQLEEVYFARLQPGGTKIDPPGDVRITCCNKGAQGTSRRDHDTAWTGAEYGLVYMEESGSGVTGDIFFKRVSASGTPIGNPVPVTPDAGKRANNPAIAWNGREFGVVWDEQPGVNPDTPRHVYFARIGCNCTDLDGDLYSTCAGHDCNDSDPLVNPAAVEVCVNGIDDNCDAAIDCQDQTSCPPGPGSAPGEVSGVGFTDRTTLVWSVEPSSDVYDVLHGRLSELRTDGGYGRSSCLAWREPGTSLTVSETPVAGEGYYYLVRGKADPCRLGTWGDALRDAAKLTCP